MCQAPVANVDAMQYALYALPGSNGQEHPVWSKAGVEHGKGWAG